MTNEQNALRDTISRTLASLVRKANDREDHALCNIVHAAFAALSYLRFEESNKNTRF